MKGHHMSRFPQQIMIAALLVLSLMLPGCDGGSSNQSGTTPTNAGGTPARKMTIGVSLPAADHGWTAGVNWWAKQAMAEYPEIQWVYTTADKPEKQIADIEDMMVRGIDALVVLATESAPLTPVAKKVHQRGIYLVNVDRGFLEPVADVMLEGDNRAFGRKSAEFVVEKLGGKGKIVVLEGIPSTVNTARVKAASEVFAKHPGIKVLDSQPAHWNREKGLAVMQAYLAKFPKIDAVWAQDDDIALGAEQAIKEAGRSGEMWIFGGAGMKDIIKRVADRDPMYPADITYPPAMVAAGVHLAAAQVMHKDLTKAFDKLPKHLHLTKEQLAAPAGADSQRHIVLEVQLVTPENASEFYFPDSVY